MPLEVLQHFKKQFCVLIQSSSVHFRAIDIGRAKRQKGDSLIGPLQRSIRWQNRLCLVRTETCSGVFMFPRRGRYPQHRQDGSYWANVKFERTRLVSSSPRIELTRALAEGVAFQPCARHFQSNELVGPPLKLGMSLAVG